MRKLYLLTAHLPKKNTITDDNMKEMCKLFKKNLKLSHKIKRLLNVAENAKKDIETQLGKTVISPLNASDKPALEIKTDE